MPDPSDRGARARPAVITPLTDDTIEVHDLDSSFDLGAFGAESDPVRPAASHHPPGDVAPTAHAAARNEPRPVQVSFAELIAPVTGTAVSRARVTDAPAFRNGEVLPASDEVARPEAPHTDHDLRMREPEARSGNEVADQRPLMVRALGRHWAPLTAAAILLVGLAIGIVGLRGGRQVDRAARARAQQPAAAQATDARAMVPTAATTSTLAKTESDGAKAIAGRTPAASPAPPPPKPRGPRASGAVRAAAVIVASSSAAPAPAMASARQRSPQAASATLERAVSTRGVIPQRSAVRAPVAEAPPRMPSGAPAGWLRIDAPVNLDLSVDGTFLGTTRQAPALVSAGVHEVVVADARAGFRRTSRVRVQPGETSTLVVVVPDGALSVEAQPDAQVFVDGTPLGTTPLERIPVAAGVRKVVVRNASLGERTYEVVVREGQHTALSVDLRPR